MSAFKKAWGILKENDDVPDEDFHRLNDPNPTIAIGAAIRNNPMIADMMARQEEAYKKPYSEGGYIHECQHCGKRTDINYDDVYSEQFCSQRCSQGENPTCRELSGQDCDFKLSSSPEYDRYHSQNTGNKEYQVSLKCPKCDNELWGWVSE